MRYRVLDLPTAGVGAFMPLPSTNAPASSWGLVHVHGSPGTEPIPSPSPQSRGYLPSLTRLGGVNSAQGSTVAPDVILPSVYVAETANMGPAADSGVGMLARRLNPLPVPAVNQARRPVVAQNTPRYGGRSTMAWPRAFQRFPIATCPTPG